MRPFGILLRVQDRAHLRQHLALIGSAVLSLLGVHGEVVQLIEGLCGRSEEWVRRHTLCGVPVVEAFVVVVELPELIDTAVAGRERGDDRLDPVPIDIGGCSVGRDW